jgi:hypothetical protein
MPCGDDRKRRNAVAEPAAHPGGEAVGEQAALHTKGGAAIVLDRAAVAALQVLRCTTYTIKYNAHTS